MFICQCFPGFAEHFFLFLEITSPVNLLEMLLYIILRNYFMPSVLWTLGENLAHTPTRPQRWMKLCRKFQILAYSSWYPPFAFQFHLRVSLCKCSPIYKKAKSEDILWRASEKKIHKVDLKWMPSNRTQSLVSSFIYCKLKYIRSSVWFWEWKKKLTHFYQTDINNKTSFLFTDSAN